MAVECCIKSGRMADALILAAYGGSSLWAKTQATYFKKNSSPFIRVGYFLSNFLRIFKGSQFSGKWTASRDGRTN